MASLLVASAVGSNFELNALELGNPLVERNDTIYINSRQNLMGTCARPLDRNKFPKVAGPTNLPMIRDLMKVQPLFKELLIFIFDIDLKLDGEVLSLVKAFIKLECSKDCNGSGKVHRGVQRRIVTNLTKRDEKI